MSEENVTVVRLAIEAFNSRDLQVLAQILDDDFEFVSVLTGVDGGGATYTAPKLGPNTSPGWMRFGTPGGSKILPSLTPAVTASSALSA